MPPKRKPVPAATSPMDIDPPRLPEKPRTISKTAWQRVKDAWPWLVAALGIAGALTAVAQLGESNNLNADTGLDLLAQTTRSVAPAVADMAGTATDLLTAVVTRPLRDEVLRTQNVAENEFSRLESGMVQNAIDAQYLLARLQSVEADLAARTGWLAAQLAPANQLNPGLAGQIAQVMVPQQVVQDPPMPPDVPALIPIDQQYLLGGADVEQFAQPPKKRGRRN